MDVRDRCPVGAKAASSIKMRVTALLDTKLRYAIQHGRSIDAIAASSINIRVTALLDTTLRYAIQHGRSILRRTPSLAESHPQLDAICGGLPCRTTRVIYVFYESIHDPFVNTQ